MIENYCVLCCVHSIDVCTRPPARNRANCAHAVYSHCEFDAIRCRTTIQISHIKTIWALIVIKCAVQTDSSACVRAHTHINHSIRSTHRDANMCYKVIWLFVAHNCKRQNPFYSILLVSAVAAEQQLTRCAKWPNVLPFRSNYQSISPALNGPQWVQQRTETIQRQGTFIARQQFSCNTGSNSISAVQSKIAMILLPCQLFWRHQLQNSFVVQFYFAISFSFARCGCHLRFRWVRLFIFPCRFSARPDVESNRICFKNWQIWSFLWFRLIRFELCIWFGWRGFTKLKLPI